MSRSSRSRSPRERLVEFVHELERLEEEKQAIADAMRAEFRTAKAAGFDPGTLRVVLRLRKLTPAQRKERRALEAIYLAALGMLEGDPLPDEARRRLDEQEAPAPPERERGSGWSEQEKGPDREQKPARESPPPPPQQRLVLKDPEEARQEGRDAATVGKRIYDNPFPAGDPCRAAWDEGWCERSKSHGMDTPAAYQRRTKPPERSEKDADEKGPA